MKEIKNYYIAYNRGKIEERKEIIDIIRKWAKEWENENDIDVDDLIKIIKEER